MPRSHLILSFLCNFCKNFKTKNAIFIANVFKLTYFVFLFDFTLWMIQRANSEKCKPQYRIRGRQTVVHTNFIGDNLTFTLESITKTWWAERKCDRFDCGSRPRKLWTLTDRARRGKSRKSRENKSTFLNFFDFNGSLMVVGLNVSVEINVVLLIFPLYRNI